MKYVSGALMSLALIGFFATFAMSLTPFMERGEFEYRVVAVKRTGKGKQQAQRRVRPTPQLASGSLR